MNNIARSSVLVLLLFAVTFSACVFKSSTSTTQENTNTNANSATNANADPNGTPNAGSAQSAATLPETLVSDLYKAHDAKKSPFFQTKDRALVDRFFARSLGDLIWKDATSNKNEVGAIDGDPLYNAQDTEIKNLAVGKGEVKGERATVAVTFTNYGEKQTVNYTLIMENGGWKIDNILYGDGDSLMKWLKDTYEGKPDRATVSNGNFEGRYSVGPTTCTVRPAKMSFEVRWAKGSGVEMYFAKDALTYEAQTDEGDTNSFIFDDESLSTGTFYRTDGTTFAIKRLK